MASIHWWRGEGENPCICEHCTQGGSVKVFYGELCPGCNEQELIDIPEFPGWLGCVTCNFMARDAGLEDSEIEEASRVN